MCSTTKGTIQNFVFYGRTGYSIIETLSAYQPYSRTAPQGVTPCAFRGWDFNLETLNSRQRLGQTLNLLRFRVQLSEYYNFGRIDLLDDGPFWSMKWPS